MGYTFKEKAIGWVTFDDEVIKYFVILVKEQYILADGSRKNPVGEKVSQLEK
jgi:hypothetical protein